jgi:hypothetical protein
LTSVETDLSIPRTMSRRICLGLAAFIIWAGAWGGTARAHAARPRIAVLGVTAEHLPAEVREKIAAAVAGGLAASGADVVDSAATTKGAESKGIVDCETPTCRIAIAEATGARYLMRGSVETMGRSYTVHLEMIDGTTGTVIGVREDRCEICTENEAYETASVTASALKAEIVKRPVAAGDDVAAREVAIANAGDPAATGAGATPMLSVNGRSPASGEENRPHMRGWSWASMGVGAAAIAAGIVLVSLDGKFTCDAIAPDRCPHEYDTRGAGISLITGGALAAVLGTALLVGKF